MEKNQNTQKEMFVYCTPTGLVTSKLCAQPKISNNLGYNEFACVQNKQKSSESKPKGDSKVFFF
jgi:hypothetical protein